MSKASEAALRPAPSSKPGVVSGPAPCHLPVGAAAYRAMPPEAQARRHPPSTDRDPAPGFSTTGWPRHDNTEARSTVDFVLAERVAASATASAFTPSARVTGSGLFFVTASTKAAHLAP